MELILYAEVKHEATIAQRQEEINEFFIISFLNYMSRDHLNVDRYVKRCTYYNPKVITEIKEL